MKWLDFKFWDLKSLGVLLVAALVLTFVAAGPVMAQTATDATATEQAAPATEEAAPAEEAAAPDLAALENAYVLNTFSFLINGALVMWMAAGFAMLESGLVRTKNTAAICLKNIALYAAAGIIYYLIGYDLMYTGVDGGYIGTLSLFYNPSGTELDLIAGTTGSLQQLLVNDGATYSSMSDWFFQMVFVATAASIVSGTVAERVKIWPFMIFTLVLSGILYPIEGSWIWGGGWLSEMGFSDFAGSTVVHSVGGWAAITGAIILGARRGKFGPGGAINAIPGANLPLATLGTFILWLGWFGFNGGSQLALASAADAANMSIVFVNTNLAAAAGCCVAMLLTQLLYGKLDLTFVLNGCIAGLVSITAGPDLSNPLFAIIVGGIGGALVVVAVPLVDRLRIDDVVGAISAHLVAGIWGTLAVGIFGSGTFLVQLTGVVSVAVFMIVTSAIVWLVLKYTVGIRVSPEEEDAGSDKIELGLEAYPEFGAGSGRV